MRVTHEIWRLRIRARCGRPVELDSSGVERVMVRHTLSRTAMECLRGRAFLVSKETEKKFEKRFPEMARTSDSQVLRGVRKRAKKVSLDPAFAAFASSAKHDDNNLQTTTSLQLSSTSSSPVELLLVSILAQASKLWRNS